MTRVLLFLIALILFCIFAPIGFIVTLIPKRNWWWHIKKYSFKLAHTIDQSGNVVCEDMFNYTLIKKNAVNKFGNPDETISSVIGKNKVKNNLTKTGNILDNILDKIDPNHSIKSIDETE